MGRASFKAGGVFAQNLQAGSVTITLDGNGDGTSSVVFSKPMKSTPVVQLTAAEKMVTGVISLVSTTATGFEAAIDGTDLTGSIVVNYLAMDDSYN